MTVARDRNPDVVGAMIVKLLGQIEDAFLDSRVVDDRRPHWSMTRCCDDCGCLCHWHEVCPVCHPESVARVA